MPRTKFPDALAMRRLKYEAGASASRDAVAQTLRAADRRAEAVLLYERAPDHPSLREDLDWAVEHGVSFLVLLLRRMGTPVPPEALASCAAAAERRERWYDAHRLHTALADEAGIARVAEKLPGFRPAIPHNKV